MLNLARCYVTPERRSQRTPSPQPLSGGGYCKSPSPGGRVSQQPRSRSLVPTQRLGTRTLSLTDDQLDRQLGIQVLPDSQKGQRNIGSPGGRQNVGDPRSRQHVGGPRSRQDVGSPGPVGTAVFQAAYGPHDQLAATLSADALRAAPNNAGQPAGLIPVYTPA